MKLNKVKIIAYVGFVSLLISLLIGVYGYDSTDRSIQEIKDELLENHVRTNALLAQSYAETTYGKLTQGKGTLLTEDGRSIENDFVVVDRILNTMGDRATFFVKEKNDFKRISTNIPFEGEDGDKNRAIGTYLERESPAYEAAVNGEVYIGEVDILNESYYTVYQPITDDYENVIGIFFIGVPTERLEDTLNVLSSEMATTNTVLVVLRTISLGSLIALVAISSGILDIDRDVDKTRPVRFRKNQKKK